MMSIDNKEWTEHMEKIVADFSEKHRAATSAAHLVAIEMDIGPERVRAFEIYERLRTATFFPTGD